MNSPVRIVATESLIPQTRFDAEASERALNQWLASRPEEERTRARRILRNSGIEARHSCLSAEDVLRPCSLTESSERYRHHSRRLGVSLLDRTLRRAGVNASDVDVLVTTSCSGYMIPSVDAFMASELGMRADLLRLPVTLMGCAGGAASMMYAAEMLRGRSQGIAAIVNIELPTNAMQLEDFSMDNIVSTVLFSDGLACMLLEKGGSRRGPSIESWRTMQVPHTIDLLGYNLTNTGFRMKLDSSLPEVVENHFEKAVESLLGPSGLTLADIRHFVIHPGGVKILDRIESILRRYGGTAALSRETMRDFGNMSSSTVGVVLQRLLQSNPEPGKVLVMGFGPGFGTHMLLLTIPAKEAS